MSDYTFQPCPPSAWDAFFAGAPVAPDFVASRRSTTSSKTPGQKNKGTVYHQRREWLPCPDCGAVRIDFDSPHAPHFNADGIRVDCIGFPAEAA